MVIIFVYGCLLNTATPILTFTSPRSAMSPSILRHRWPFVFQFVVVSPMIVALAFVPNGDILLAGDTETPIVGPIPAKILLATAGGSTYGSTAELATSGESSFEEEQEEQEEQEGGDKGHEEVSGEVKVRLI